MGRAQFDQRIVTGEGDLVIDGDVDIPDRAGRNVGKIRLMDDSGTLIHPQEHRQNAGGTYSDSHGSGGSFSSHMVPDGFEVAYLADPGNGGTVTVNDVPLAAGRGISLAVENVNTPSTSVPTAGDTVYAIVEDSA